MGYLVHSSVQESFKINPIGKFMGGETKVFLTGLRFQARHSIKGEFGSWRGRAGICECGSLALYSALSCL